jgi:lethal(3)malignant brain tumor-like protein
LLEYDVHPEIPCVWTEIRSPFIHPCDHHKTIDNPENFIPPVRPFSWDDYLKDTKCKQSPTDFLVNNARPPYNFHTGQKLEVVDPVNQQLVRPATILCREDYKIQVIFDGFDLSFAFWLDDDSEDVHPINWCEKSGHPIEHPAGFNKIVENKICKNSGCRGIGNTKSHDKFFHDVDSECPYSKDNWKKMMNMKLHQRTDTKAVAKK